MNRHDFTQTGGFPLDDDILDFQQSRVDAVQQLSNLCGTRAIVNGCVLNGGYCSAGWLVIDGELLPLEAGNVDAKISIVETRTNLNYQDGSQWPSEIVRKAKFGDDGHTQILWSDFKRNLDEGVLSRLERLEWLTAPLMVGHGSMVLWRKPASVPLPVGWQEVVDWRGRTVMGYDPNDPMFDDVGSDFGGAKGKILTAANIPKLIGKVPATTNNAAGTGGASFGYQKNGEVPITIGNDAPVELETLDPYRVVMFIEPIPGFKPAL